MKKIIIFIFAAFCMSSVFATGEHNMEEYSGCYITPENQAEWDEEEAKIEAIINCPELAYVFDALDEALEENGGYYAQ